MKKRRIKMNIKHEVEMIHLSLEVKTKKTIIRLKSYLDSRLVAQTFFQPSQQIGIIYMGFKKDNSKPSKQAIPPQQSEDSDEESNETMPVGAMEQLSLTERANSNETVAPQQKQHTKQHDPSKSKAIRKRTKRTDCQEKDKMRQKINSLNKRIQQLEEQLKIAHQQEDSCPHCHFYLNQPKIIQKDTYTRDDSMMLDCFKRSTSRDSIQFQKVDFTAPLMYSSDMEEKSWVFLGTILIAMGSKVMDMDGTINVFKVVKESVDRIRRQVQKSQQKLSMDFFLTKEQIEGEGMRMDQLSFDPFYQTKEHHGGLQLEGVRVESVEQHELYFDQKLTFNIKYDALITVMEYMKENSNITFA